MKVTDTALLKVEFLDSPVSDKVFDSVLNYIDENADGNIDSYEIFQAYGIKRTCSETANFLGLTDIYQYTQSKMYSPNDIKLSSIWAYSLEDIPYSQCDDFNYNENENQQVFDLFLSLGEYFKNNNDLIQKLEKSGLYSTCTVPVQPEPQATVNTSKRKRPELDEELPIFAKRERLQLGCAVGEDGDPDCSIEAPVKYPDLGRTPNEIMSRCQTDEIVTVLDKGTPDERIMYKGDRECLKKQREGFLSQLESYYLSDEIYHGPDYYDLIELLSKDPASTGHISELLAMAELGSDERYAFFDELKVYATEHKGSDFEDSNQYYKNIACLIQQFQSDRPSLTERSRCTAK